MVFSSTLKPTSDTSEIFERITWKKAIIDSQKCLHSMFTRLRKLSLEVCVNELRSLDIAKNNENRNYEYDSVPQDGNRVKISPTENNEDGYVNAIWMYYPKIQQQYILFSALCPDETPYFWQMIFEQKTKNIIVLSDQDRSRHRWLNVYYPDKFGDIVTHGEYTIVCEEYEVEETFIRRKLMVLDKVKGYVKPPHKVYQYQILFWDDKLSPDLTMFTDFHEFLRSEKTAPFHKVTSKQQKCEPGAPVIQCSTGVGRVGTFVLADVLRRMLDLNVKDMYNLEDMVLKLRIERTQGINSSVELEFLYDYISKILIKIDPPLNFLGSYIKARALKFPKISESEVEMDRCIKSQQLFGNKKERENYLRRHKPKSAPAEKQENKQPELNEEDKKIYSTLNKIYMGSIVNDYITM